MTLAFMEREYSTPEEPHLGIVHIVEVGTSPPPPPPSTMFLFPVVKRSKIEAKG